MFRPLILAAAMMAASTATAGELVLSIEGVRSNGGTLRAALYDQAAEFLEPERFYQANMVRAAKGTATIIFAGLPAGRYAVAIYHDENGDQKLNRNLIGIPQEGLGFTNGAEASFGPPKFAEAAVAVGADGRVSDVIKLKY